MESPAPLVGGNRAGYRIAKRLLDNTAPIPDQSVVRHRGPRLVVEPLAEIRRHQETHCVLAAISGGRFPPAPVPLVHWPP
jgi:hypothetical protein